MVDELLLYTDAVHMSPIFNPDLTTILVYKCFLRAPFFPTRAQLKSNPGRFCDLLSLEVSRASRELPGSAARELLRENCSESSHDSSHDSERGVPAVLQLGVRYQFNGN